MERAHTRSGFSLIHALLTIWIISLYLSPDGWAQIVFNNGEWIIEQLDAPIPEAPFEVQINGNPNGTTKLLAFENRVPGTSRFPQVFVIYSSGFLRIKAGGDPTPALPFGQSLVLGPTIFGTSTSFPASTLFFNPQLQTVDINTSQLNPDGTGNLLIQVIANDAGLPPTDTHTNQIMNQTWDITLQEPTNEQTRVDVAGMFTFTENITPDPTRTAEFQSFRLLQVSSLFIDDARHDVDALRIRDAARGPFTCPYSPGLANTLLPLVPNTFDPTTIILESLHRDDVGQPNGNTPSYTILMGSTTGPISGPITPRAFFMATQDVNNDNLGLWLHQQPLNMIPQGTNGSIRYAVLATTDPFPTPQLTLSVNQPSFRPGETLRVGLKARNVGPAFNADFYFGVVLPDGITVCFFTSLSPPACAIRRLDGDPRTFPPLLPNVIIPQGLDAMLNDLLVFPFQGGEPPGTYVLFTALTPPGALGDGRIDVCDFIEIKTQAFSFGP